LITYRGVILQFSRTLGKREREREKNSLPPKMSAAADTQLDRFDTIFSLEGKVAVVTGGSRGLGLNAASG
jgi:hypothetical protein